ncbi:MAG: 2-oxoglutarate oxidoreductase [Thermoprotei archaeon]|nr:MAG: 2-oxoglutarate oxidoreductase [Thermoprotei archaeon]
MRKEIIIVGKGGQGILLAGHLLSDAIAKNTNYHVVNMVFYGAETRGTESRTEVVIADNAEEADYFMARKADIAIFMHPEYVPKYIKKLKHEALVIADSSYDFSMLDNIENLRVFKYPFTITAEQKLGTARVANVIMLGFLLALTNIVDIDSLKKSIRENIKKRWVKVNLKALELGYSEGLKAKENLG